MDQELNEQIVDLETPLGEEISELSETSLDDVAGGLGFADVHGYAKGAYQVAKDVRAGTFSMTQALQEHLPKTGLSEERQQAIHGGYKAARDIHSGYKAAREHLQAWNGAN